MQSFGDLSTVKQLELEPALTGLIESCVRRKCFHYLFIEMECILLRFPTYVIGSSLEEIEKLKIQGSQIKIM